MNSEEFIREVILTVASNTWPQQSIRRFRDVKTELDDVEMGFRRVVFDVIRDTNLDGKPLVHVSLAFVSMNSGSVEESNPHIRFSCVSKAQKLTQLKDGDLERLAVKSILRGEETMEFLEKILSIFELKEI